MHLLGVSVFLLFMRLHYIVNAVTNTELEKVRGVLSSGVSLYPTLVDCIGSVLLTTHSIQSNNKKPI
jgi:hypothetical protein